MNIPFTYDTVSEAITDLIRRGYTTDFELRSEKEVIQCRTTGTELSPDDFVIDETYRFEGSTDPGDEMILFAISSVRHPVKGYVLNAYGMYADNLGSSLVRNLRRAAAKPQPIKRHDQLKPVSREHHHALLLGWKIRTGLKKGVAPGRIKAYAEWFFARHLQPHFLLEEQFLFPIVGWTHEGVKKALADHVVLAKIIDSGLDTPEGLLSFAQELEAHIRFEERILFNQIQESATEEQWFLLQAHHADIHFEELMLDPFWLT